ncbi:MAG: hypothetical protein ACREQF_12240 [Candidatus Binataceae bacterium]
MKLRVDAPELVEQIEAHAGALAAGDAAAAESHVAAEALEAHRAIFSARGSTGTFEGCEALARAKIGSQFMSKIRLSGGGEGLTLLNRWKKSADGKWRIVEIDDLSTKRSGWSDIAPLGVSRSESRNG